MTNAKLTLSRKILYGAVLTVLVGANAWRWSASDETAQAPGSALIQPGFAKLPGLNVARDFDAASLAPSRDLFGHDTQTPRPSEIIKPTAPVRKLATAKTIALANAQKIFDGIVVLGILGSQDGPVAVVEYQGAVKSLVQGEFVLPGYFVKSLSLQHLEIRNDELGVDEYYLVNEADGN
jgi:hypothetical protein